MKTDEYLELLYPFGQLDLMIRETDSLWNVNQDRMMQALWQHLAGTAYCFQCSVFNREFDLPCR